MSENKDTTGLKSIIGDLIRYLLEIFKKLVCSILKFIIELLKIIEVIILELNPFEELNCFIKKFFKFIICIFVKLMKRLHCCKKKCKCKCKKPKCCEPCCKKCSGHPACDVPKPCCGCC